MNHDVTVCRPDLRDCVGTITSTLFITFGFCPPGAEYWMVGDGSCLVSLTVAVRVWLEMRRWLMPAAASGGRCAGFGRRQLLHWLAVVPVSASQVMGSSRPDSVSPWYLAGVFDATPRGRVNYRGAG